VKTYSGDDTKSLVRSRLNQVEATVLTTTNRVLILNKKAMRIRVVGGEDKGA
jgi:hypothetical protein